MSNTLELDIHDLSHDGRGVGRIDGKAVFVAGALAGERVRVSLQKRKRKFDQADLLEVLTASPHRIEPGCPHFGTCGGCALQHLSPVLQIAAKQRVLMENLERIGHLQPATILPPLTGAPWGYRRKARLGVKHVRQKNRVLVGFRELKDPRFIADIDRCPVLVPQVGERLGELASLIQSLDARDRIAQIEVAAGDQQTVLVFRNLDPLNESDRAALVAFGQASGLAVMLQPGGADSLQLLWPQKVELKFVIEAAGLTLDFLPLDFVQVNADLNQKMVRQAIALLDPSSTDRVLDLFCGLGNFTLPLAQRTASVVGVEGDAGLVLRARENAARNGIVNASFHAADLAKPLDGEVWMREPFDKILLDPPRTGADGVISQLKTKGVSRIVYVSCHPGSLARDAAMLVNQHGFCLSAAGAMDMFPHTAHVESIAVFDRHS